MDRTLGVVYPEPAWTPLPRTLRLSVCQLFGESMQTECFVRLRLSAAY